MTQKKTKPKPTPASREKPKIIETIRKSQLAASNAFEIQKLSRPQDGFLNCSIEEERESLIIHYDVQNLLPFRNIRKEKRELMFSVGTDAGKL